MDNPPTETENNFIPIEWSAENEVMLVEWCDIAQCYKWFNNRSHINYESYNAWFTIPAICLSTLTGSLSFAQTSVPSNFQTYIPLIIGGVNIFTGILTTVHQYLKIAQLNESYRISSISWDKFSRNIRTELAKKPSERMDAGHFIKLCRNEYDRLMETSPLITQKIVDEFNKTFSGKDGTIEREHFDELIKPDICNIIVSANHSRHSWYKDDKNKNLDVIQDYVDIFQKGNGRNPMIDEINDFIKKNNIKIDSSVKNYLNNYNSFVLNLV